MSTKFTDSVQKTLELAETEARLLNHHYVGTEHLLLALLQTGTGLSADVLKTLGLDADNVRREIEKLITRGPEAIPAGQIPLTPRAKRAIEYGIDEARLMNQAHMSTEHLLLGLFREPDGVAAKVLESLGLKQHEVYQKVLKVRLKQMKLVESVVRPVRTSAARKRKMREELLAHLETIYSEEQARLNDSEEAFNETAKRFGDPSELTREFQSAVSLSERRAHWFERVFGWRAPESAERFVMRQTILTFAIMAIAFCIPVIYMLIYSGGRLAWAELRSPAGLLLFTPGSQFLLEVSYLKLRDALLGPPWARKSFKRVMVIDSLILLIVLACGFGFITLSTGDLNWAARLSPVFLIIGLLTAFGYHHMARSRGPVEISDTYWACLKLE